MFLSGSRMKHNKEAEYLGVSIDKDGVTTTKTMDRLRSARSRIVMLSTLGMFKGGFKTERNVTHIQSVHSTGIRILRPPSTKNAKT